MAEEEEKGCEQAQAEAEQTPWSFSMEMLPRVHALRLSLSTPAISPSRHCLHLRTSLCPPSPSLLCSWVSSDDHLPHSILLPLPLLLYDHCAPILSSALEDRLEFRMQLLPVGLGTLSPFFLDVLDDVPEDGSLIRKSDSSINSSIKSDGQALASHGDVVFYCRSCSRRLLKEPLREILQLPSNDWREVAENCFGTCCCSFGVKMEFLVAEFENTFSVKQQNERLGTCLAGPVSCYVQCVDIMPGCLLEEEILTKPKDIGCAGKKEAGCVASGNGFITRESELTREIRWFSVHCSGCSSLLGACSTKKDLEGVSGVHLFKYKISTSKVPGSKDDIFRHLNLQNIVGKELQLSSEEIASYRYVIRDLNSRLPLLQLVILNSDSWMCLGSCMENPVGTESSEKGNELSDAGKGTIADGSINAMRPTFKAIVKIMFLIIGNLDATGERLAKDWALQLDAENLYMLGEVVDNLIAALIGNKLAFPASSDFPQDFSLSFLERLHDLK